MTIDNAHIRHQNFMALYQRFRDDHASLPERGMLKLFADRLALSDRYLSHIKCKRKNIGNNVGCSIEKALALQHGWMDREHEVAEAITAAASGNSEQAEQVFLETARALYRSDPESARLAIMELLRKRLWQAVPDHALET